MTEETVARLDYTQTPPGLYVRPDMRGAFGPHPNGPGYEFGDRTFSSQSFLTESEALAAAWSRHKGLHDPPGLEVRWLGERARYGVFPQGRYEQHVAEARSPEEALAAAWAWYDRRLALAGKLAVRGDFDAARTGSCPWWPHILTWSDEEVAAVERWLVDSTAEMPEVLRG